MEQIKYIFDMYLENLYTWNFLSKCKYLIAFANRFTLRCVLLETNDLQSVNATVI